MQFNLKEFQEGLCTWKPPCFFYFKDGYLLILLWILLLLFLFNEDKTHPFHLILWTAIFSLSGHHQTEKSSLYVSGDNYLKSKIKKLKLLTC